MFGKIIEKIKKRNCFIYQENKTSDIPGHCLARHSTRSTYGPLQAALGWPSSVMHVRWRVRVPSPHAEEHGVKSVHRVQ